jgi:MSHA pilin protein MshA
MGKRTKQRGYTLIDLIVVMVILAIMSTVAVAKYLDLHEDAKGASAQSVAGTLTSASVANYLVRVKGPAPNTSAIADCADVAGLLMPGSLSTFVIESQPVAPGNTASCTLKQTSGAATSATFTAYGIS